MVKLITRRKAIAGAVSATALALPKRALAEPKTHEVRIMSFAFVPELVEVKVGDKIRWINEDLAPHTATANEFGWDTSELGTDQSAEITVVSDMETTYFCIFHPHMKGRISIA